MKNANSTILVCFSLGILFLMLLNQANAEDRKQPRKNVNLSPFESWRSAYFCILNTSAFCEAKANHTIKLSGWLSVEDSDISEFCKPGGCYDHTLLVLQCIQDVKRDFNFANHAPVPFVKNVTVRACTATERKGFNTNYKVPNSA